MDKRFEDEATGKAVLETWFRRVWSEGDTAAIDEMFPSLGRADGLGSQQIVGPEAFRAFHAAFVNLVKEIRIVLDQCTETGGWTAALCSLGGICQKTGKSVTMTGSVFARIQDGKILEAYNHWDFMGLWGQLGFLPVDAFERGLRGERMSSGGDGYGRD